ncbi:protein of unknown function [Methylorubrum extorquens DM4]|uniref:Uncharacterized protein n=1 Tax=Methylorubrum extorquens (strain DSM 6343 / CIP 106787 / DM4) TaxID=661410 RepID=C7CLF9_METED|nr:protein of unknown function [Methylorubrum extorquens DM4]
MARLMAEGALQVNDEAQLMTAPPAGAPLRAIPRPVRRVAVAIGPQSCDRARPGLGLRGPVPTIPAATARLLTGR